MYNFKQFLTESAAEKLRHLEHIEDRVFEGPVGFGHAYQVLSNVHNKLRGYKNSTSISTKYDGSTSVVWGHHPENGKFFVGSKSVFNKTPKINYSFHDIQANHSDNPGLASKLNLALHHLQKITPDKGVYQGDLMYTRDQLQSDDKNHSFTPNTITYKVKRKSEDGQKIDQAHIGIVPHTTYQGKTFNQLKSSPDVNLKKFKNNPDVHMMNADYNFTGEYKPSDRKAFDKHLSAADRSFGRVDKKIKPFLESHFANLQKYVNHTIRNDEKPTVDGYSSFINGAYEKSIRGTQQPLKRMDHTIGQQKASTEIKQHSDSLKHIFDAHHHLQNAKHVLLSVLDSNQQLSHSIGNKKTGPEGYVVNYAGQSSKLVNRQVFSKNNFARWEK